ELERADIAALDVFENARKNRDEMLDRFFLWVYLLGSQSSSFLTRGETIFTGAKTCGVLAPSFLSRYFVPAFEFLLAGKPHPVGHGDLVLERRQLDRAVQRARESRPDENSSADSIGIVRRASAFRFAVRRVHCIFLSFSLPCTTEMHRMEAKNGQLIGVGG